MPTHKPEAPFSLLYGLRQLVLSEPPTLYKYSQVPLNLTDQNKRRRKMSKLRSDVTDRHNSGDRVLCSPYQCIAVFIDHTDRIK